MLGVGGKAVLFTGMVDVFCLCDSIIGHLYILTYIKIRKKLNSKEYFECMYLFPFSWISKSCFIYFFFLVLFFIKGKKNHPILFQSGSEKNY